MIDKNGANTAAVRGLIADSGAAIELRQSKYLNNIVEQDHRAIKRRTRPMMGFKSLRSAARIIAGIETMHMVTKGQLGRPEGLAFSPADYCSLLQPGGRVNSWMASPFHELPAILRQGPLWNLSGDRAALEATGRLKSTVLGVHDSLIYDRMLSTELLMHFDEMSEVQAQRLRLALPQRPEQQMQARLAIARAYTCIAVKERESAVSLMAASGLTARFAPQVAEVVLAFERTMSERDRLVAAWSRLRECPTPSKSIGDVIERALVQAGVSKSEYAELCQLSPATASKHLGQLLLLGLLQRSGRGPATRYHAIREWPLS